MASHRGEDSQQPGHVSRARLRAVGRRRERAAASRPAEAVLIRGWRGFQPARREATLAPLPGEQATQEQELPSWIVPRPWRKLAVSFEEAAELK